MNKQAFLLGFGQRWAQLEKAAAAAKGLKNTSPYPGQEMAKTPKPAKVPMPAPGGGTSGSPTYLGLSPGNPSPTAPLPPYQMPVMGSPVGTQTGVRTPEQKSPSTEQAY